MTVPVMQIRPVGMGMHQWLVQVCMRVRSRWRQARMIVGVVNIIMAVRVFMLGRHVGVRV